MSKIAVHLDPMTRNVVGLWMNLKGRPTSYYVGTDFQRQIGERDIVSRIRGSFDSYVERLAERIPSDIWWEAADRVGNETLPDAYARLTKVS